MVLKAHQSDPYGLFMLSFLTLLVEPVSVTISLACEEWHYLFCTLPIVILILGEK
jgi:hypothetical protein